MSATDAPVNGASAVLKAVARILFVLSLVLLTQFMFGITVNLFITISKTHPGAGVANYVVGAAESWWWAVTREWPYLALHALIGLGLVIVSLTNFVMTLVGHQPAYRVGWGSLAAFGALLAAGNGLYFLIHPDADVSSMLMATGFALMLGAIITQLYLVRRAG